MSGQPFLFEPERIDAAPGPLIQVHCGPDGGPVGATAARVVRAPPERVWRTVSDVSSYGGRVPMMDHVRVDGAYATAQLRFGVSLFSARFSFKVERAIVEGRSLDLRHVAGEPKDIHIRFDLAPGATSGASRLHVTTGFDVFSLGWLVKVFFKHHPEIRFGVHPGCALGLLETMAGIAEAGR